MTKLVDRPWRHRRVWLLPSLPAADVLASGPQAVQAVHAVLAWVAQGRPLVGRARLPEDPAPLLPLGLAQRIEGRKLRWAVGVAPQAVDRVDEPLTLAEVAPLLPASMQATAQRLVADAAALDMPLRVYGSAFWQHGGEGDYLHGSSDLDLLAQPATAAQARQWLAALTLRQAASPVRLDGEVELPGGDAVAWRELAGTGSSLLVKSDAGPSLRTRAEVWRAWTLAETSG